MILREALARGSEYLARHGVPSPRVDAEHLLGHALGLSRLQLYLEHDRPLTGAERGVARELLGRRARREPLAYILGEWGFRGLTLRVDRRVLVPRPETEVVVERCLARLQGLESPLVLDVGTGSGAIALALAAEHPGARVLAVDASEDALAVARDNAAASGLAARVTFARADVSQGLSPAPGPFDLVVSNPPYVPEEELAGLEPEVRDWEPREALVDTGQTEQVAAAVRDVVRPGGWLVLETHWRKGRDVARRLESLGYEVVAVSPDLAGHERVVEVRWPA